MPLYLILEYISFSEKSIIGITLRSILEIRGKIHLSKITDKSWVMNKALTPKITPLIPVFYSCTLSSFLYDESSTSGFKFIN